MKLRRVVLQNFRSHAETELDFHDGLTALVGPNGAGKSSVVQAIMWALFGADALPVSNTELVREGQAGMAVLVNFEAPDGSTYSVRRRLALSGQRGVSSLELIRFRGSDDADVLTAAKITETQALIHELFGDREIAAATWYVGQGDAGLFLDSAPADRRDILGTALGLTAVWDRLWQLARTRSQLAGDAATRKESELGVAVQMAGGIEFIEQEIARGEKEHKDALATVQSTRQRHDEATERLRVLRSQHEQHQAKVAAYQGARTAHQTALQDLNDARDRAEILTAIIDRAPATRKAYEDEQQAYKDHETKQEKARKARREATEQRRKLDDELFNVRGVANDRVRLEDQRRILRQRLDELSAAGDNCSQCGQPIETAEAAAAVSARSRKWQEDLAALANAISDLPSTRPAAEVEAERDAVVIPDDVPAFRWDEDTRDNMAQLTGAEAQWATVQEQIARLITREDETKRAWERMTAPGDGVDANELAEAEADEKRIRGQLGVAETAVRGKAALVVTYQERLSSRQKAAERADELRSELADAKAALQVAETAAEGLSPRGARQLVLDTLLPQIENRANRLLQILSGNLSVELRTVATTGRETLDVWVLSEEGLRRYETWSGGQKSRVTFALRVAMSEVAAAAHGLSRLPMFIFDESFGDQDVEGRRALMQCWQALTQEVDQVVAITHDVDLLSNIDNIVRFDLVRGQTEVV